MKKTKVICTIGPASDSVEVMGKMVNVGMNCARINLSHATEDEILKTIDVVRKVRKISNLPVAIMYDTKGPEFRTLKFKDGGVTLKKATAVGLHNALATVGLVGREQFVLGLASKHIRLNIDLTVVVKRGNALDELVVSLDAVVEALVGEGQRLAVVALQAEHTVDDRGVALALKQRDGQKIAL